MKGTREYSSWQAMKTRCLNPNFPEYKNYGGRGIKVCPEWIVSFKNFYMDMGQRPIGMSLDRIDTNGDYNKGNCKWSTRQEQSDNKRSCLLVELNGERLNVTQWCKKYGLNLNTVRERIKRGWTPTEAVSKSLIGANIDG